MSGNRNNIRPSATSTTAVNAARNNSSRNIFLNDDDDSVENEKFGAEYRHSVEEKNLSETVFNDYGFGIVKGNPNFRKLKNF